MKNIFYIYILTSLVILSNHVNAQMMINLNKYKEENSSLGLPKQGENRIVFMGNSITEDWKSLSPNFFLDNNYVNRGIGGETSYQMLLRFRSDVINLKPSAVVILAGINDIAENQGPISIPDIARNIFFMSQLASENNIKVILCSVLPAYDYPWSQGKSPNIKIPKLNSMIKEYAKKSGVYYLDYFEALDNGNNGLIEVYSSDGVHLTLKGYQVMEPMIEKVLKNLL